jgi:hypothetical protein
MKAINYSRPTFSQALLRKSIYRRPCLSILQVIGKAKGTFVSESALHIFDGDKPNSVSVIAHADDHLSHPTSAGCPMTFRRSIDRRYSIEMRRYPRIQRADCPSSVLSCTAWGFSCLANCFASGELLPRLFTLACASFKEPAVSFL